MSHRRVVLIVQARMTSTRLPGKVLKPLLGRPMLGRQLDRMRRATKVDEIIVATSNLPTDDAVETFAEAERLRAFRGSEADVLARFHGAAAMASADVVVRTTADCPLIDPAVVDECVATFLEADPPYDYVSNVLARSFPRGLDTEVFTRAGLDLAFAEAREPAEREHVTPFFYRRPDRFRLGSVTRDTDESRHRWTVDTPEDFAFVEAVYKGLLPASPSFGLEQALAFVQAHPEIEALNAHVAQKHT